MPGNPWGEKFVFRTATWLLPGERDQSPTVKLIAAFAVGFAIPAMAANEASWYPVQDAKTQKCAVVDKKPVGAAYSIVGGIGHKTRVEATQVMRTTKSCAVE